MSVTTINCFLMPSRLQSHISLVLDRLQCVARVNCLVIIIVKWCSDITCDWCASLDIAYNLVLSVNLCNDR